MHVALLTKLFTDFMGTRCYAEEKCPPTKWTRTWPFLLPPSQCAIWTRRDLFWMPWVGEHAVLLYSVPIICTSPLALNGLGSLQVFAVKVPCGFFQFSFMVVWWDAEFFQFSYICWALLCVCGQLWGKFCEMPRRYIFCVWVKYSVNTRSIWFITSSSSSISV